MGKHKYNIVRSTKKYPELLHEPIKCDVLPDTIDLRSLCPEVYNQGELGSCSANAGCAANTIRLNDKNLMFSRLYLYYKERLLEHDVQDDSGAQIIDICKVLYKYGVCLEKEDPYIIANFAKEPDATDDTEALQYKISSYKHLADLNQIKSYLAAKKQPVLTGMEVYESFESDQVAATGKVPMPKAGEQMMGGHAVLIVGYKDTVKPTNVLEELAEEIFNKSTGYLIVRNSWGPEWGDHGYFYLPYEFVTSKLAFDFWTIQ